MTIRETTAMWLLYQACLTAKRTSELRTATRRAKLYVPSLVEFDEKPTAELILIPAEFPFLSHRTQAEVFRDAQQRV